MILKLLALLSVILIYGFAYLCGSLNRTLSRDDLDVDPNVAFTSGLVLGPFALLATAIRKLMK